MLFSKVSEGVCILYVCKFTLNVYVYQFFKNITTYLIKTLFKTFIRVNFYLTFIIFFSSFDDPGWWMSMEFSYLVLFPDIILWSEIWTHSFASIRSALCSDVYKIKMYMFSYLLWILFKPSVTAQLFWFSKPTTAFCRRDTCYRPQKKLITLCLVLFILAKNISDTDVMFYI